MLNIEKSDFECVIIGSGFGGTIAAIVMSNLFADDNKNAGTAGSPKEKRVCILERGQWWISHEIPSRKPGDRKPSQNMREYLEDNRIPYDFWAHPDNIEGLFKLASMSRQLVRNGLYDFRMPSNVDDKKKNIVSAITASGIGGGSLVYSNVTIRPHESVFEDWPTEKTGQGLNNYFDLAENFIGVNKITTIAGISNQKLERSLVFQTAAKNAKNNDPNSNIINENDEYDLNLSITDIPDVSTLLSKKGPLHMQKDVKDVQNDLTPDEAKGTLVKFETKYKKQNETNVCQRQGRCNLGCLPGARHTFNKKLFRAIQAQKPLDVKPLCEVYLIEFNEKEDYPYTIHFKETETRSQNLRKAKVPRKTIRSKVLIVSGGSLSTTELLLKSREKGLLLGDRLGHKFTTNADLLTIAKLKNKTIDITRGPINTSHVKFKTDDKKFAFNIEDTAIPSMVAGPFSIIFELLHADALNKKRKLSWQAKLSLLMKYPQFSFLLFTSLSLSSAQNVFTKLWSEDKFRNALLNTFLTSEIFNHQSKRSDKNNPLNRYYSIVNRLITNVEEPFSSPSERLQKFFAFSCMGVDKSNGELTLDKEKWERLEEEDDLLEKLQLKWDPSENQEIFKQIISGVKTIAKEMDKIVDTDIVPVGWDEGEPSNSRLVLLHPIGGCPMGLNQDDGVVNSYGEVFGSHTNSKDGVYPYFLVIDGSIIPSAPGVNPSLTIAAIAIRCMEHLAQKLKSDKVIESDKAIKELLIDA